MRDIWNFPDTVEWPDASIAGYSVDATDGRIGTVDAVSHAPGDSYIVVHTGKIFGKRRLVPAGAVRQVSGETKTVFLDVDREAVEGAPDHHDDVDLNDRATRDHLAATFTAPKV